MSTVHSHTHTPAPASDTTPARTWRTTLPATPPKSDVGARSTAEGPHTSAPPVSAASGPAWLEFIKRWSPAFLPPMLGILLLFVAWLLSAENGVLGAPTVSPTILIELLALYIILGMLWGIALYLTSDTLRWLLVALGGFVSYVVLTASVFWGIMGGAVLIVVIGTLGIWYARHRSHEVPLGAAAVTTLAGKHLRTLPAGVWLLAPGERVHNILGLREQTIISGPIEVRLQDEKGRRMVACAAAVVDYRFSHAAAHRVVLHPDEWARELRMTVDITLEQSLEEWARLPQSASGEPPAKQLGAHYQRDLIERSSDLGIHGIAVHMQEVELHHEDDSGVVGQHRDGSVTQSMPTPPSAIAQSAVTTPLIKSASGPHAVPSLRLASPNEPAPPLPDVLDPQVLTNAYQAIAERRITDPNTIRAIADAFAALARDPTIAATVDFDAESAARILFGHAAKLERQHKH